MKTLLSVQENSIVLGLEPLHAIILQSFFEKHKVQQKCRKHFAQKGWLDLFFCESNSVEYKNRPGMMMYHGSFQPWKSTTKKNEGSFLDDDKSLLKLMVVRKPTYKRVVGLPGKRYKLIISHFFTTGLS